MPEKYWLNKNKKWSISEIETSNLISNSLKKKIINQYSKINKNMLIKYPNLSVFEKIFFSKI